MKTAIFEIPAEAHTEIIKEMVKRGIEATTTGISDDNEIIVKAAYEEKSENDIDGFKAILHLLKFCKIVDRMQKREQAKAA